MSIPSICSKHAADEEAYNFTIIQDTDEKSTSDEEILSSAPSDNADAPRSADTTFPASFIGIRGGSRSTDSPNATYTSPSASSTPIVKR